MKTLLASSLILAISLPAFAAKPAPASDAKPADKPKEKAPATASTPTTNAPPAAPSPVPAPPPPKPAALTLDGYIATLADDIPLSKDEQTDVKTYYLNDGTKLQGILNNASLTPLQQQQQIDDLRDTRNSKIEALLADVGRKSEFLKLEGDYRVALLQLAEQGGLNPTAPVPNVPQPTSTPADQADKQSKNTGKAIAPAPAQ